jgi:chromosome partitioning protein
MDIAFVNLKPGTAKTTSAVWLSYALHQLGKEVWYIDTDPAGSGLAWSDLIAANNPGSGGFPFKVVGLPVKDVHRRARDYGTDQAIRIYDTPQAEDHAAIVRSVMRFVDEVVVPVAPNGIEINRMGPIRNEIEDIDTLRDHPVRSSVLLNRVDSRAASGDYWAGVLIEAGYHVLATRIPAIQLYSQSFGKPISAKDTAYASLGTELLERHEKAGAR